MDENNALHSFDHADGSYHLMGCMLSAASCNKWWSEEILKTKDFSAEQAPIQKLGENQVFFLPYLMGERSPHNDPSARAAFIGMSMDSTREDMTQAVLERLDEEELPVLVKTLDALSDFFKEYSNSEATANKSV